MTLQSVRRKTPPAHLRLFFVPVMLWATNHLCGWFLMGASQTGSVPEPKKRFWSKQRLLQTGSMSFAVLICIVIVLLRSQISRIGNYGYLGAFVVPLLCSATVVIPVPGLMIVFTLGAVLNPLLVGVISGIGGTFGETTGYLVGYGGRGAIENIRVYKRVEKWMKRWAPLTLFVLAIIPNPFFDVAGAAAGALRVPLWKFWLYGGAGRLIKHTAFAFAGAWGIEFAKRFIS